MKQLQKTGMKMLLAGLMVLALAATSSAQDVGQQVAQPINGINADVNAEVHREVQVEVTGKLSEPAARPRVTSPASTFGVPRSQSDSVKASASTASSKNTLQKEPEHTPMAPLSTPAAADKLGRTTGTAAGAKQPTRSGQTHLVHAAASAAGSETARSHLSFGGSQSQSDDSNPTIPSHHVAHSKRGVHGSSSKLLVSKKPAHGHSGKQSKLGGLSQKESNATGKQPF